MNSKSLIYNFFWIDLDLILFQHQIKTKGNSTIFGKKSYFSFDPKDPFNRKETPRIIKPTIQFSFNFAFLKHTKKIFASSPFF